MVATEPKVPSSDAPTRIYLARHGRTRLDAAGLLRGRLDPGIDAVGLFQALTLSDVLGRQDLQLIISSPLVRAVETARKVALRAGLEVEIDQRLADRDFGPWAGKTLDVVIARWGSLNNAPDRHDLDLVSATIEPEVELSRQVAPIDGADDCPPRGGRV
jgi:broad specificity phosphatase PhoE